MFTVAFVSLLLFGGVWVLAEVGVRHQVGRIATMAEKLAAGDLSVRVASPHPSGELGGLMTQLNATAESLQQQHLAIDELNQKLHQSQEAEVRAKKFLDAVVENIPQPIIVKVLSYSKEGNHDWRITLVNKAHEDLTGFPRTEQIGKSAREIYSEQAADIIDAADQETLISGSAVITREFPLITAGKATRLVTSKKVAIRSGDGEAQYLLTVLDDVTEKREVETRIAHMAHFDSLTDLPNRAAFNEHFAATLLHAAKTGEQFAILTIDLDRFKETNDVYGHAAGDALLQEVARRLQTATGDGFIARIGGDEFILIITDGTQPESAAAVADRLLAAFVDDFVIDGKRIRIGLGIGGAIYPTDGTDAKTLMIHSDAALYRAKAEPNGSVMFFQPEMGVESCWSDTACSRICGWR